MRCFWIPRPRLSALAAAPARTMRRSVIGAAASAAPRAVPRAARRVAGLMLFCVAGALPALDMRNPGAAPAPAPAAVAEAAPQAGAAPHAEGAAGMSPAMPLPWFPEAGAAFAPQAARWMPQTPVTLALPTAWTPGGPMPLPRPPRLLGGPGGGGPQDGPGEGLNVTAVPLPGGGTVLLGALGLALLVAPRRPQTRPSA